MRPHARAPSSQRQHDPRREMPALRLKALARLAGDDIGVGRPLSGRGILALRRRRHGARPARCGIAPEIRIARTRFARDAGEDARAEGEGQGQKGLRPSDPLVSGHEAQTFLLRQPLSRRVVHVNSMRKLTLALVIASAAVLAACGPITIGPVEPNCNNPTCGSRGH
jgi:hypothetical protein